MKEATDQEKILANFTSDKELNSEYIKNSYNPRVGHNPQFLNFFSPFNARD